MLKWKKNPVINAYGKKTVAIARKFANITEKNPKLRVIATYSDRSGGIGRRKNNVVDTWRTVVGATVFGKTDMQGANPCLRL